MEAIIVVLLIVLLVMGASLFFVLRESHKGIQARLEDQGKDIARVQEASQGTSQRIEGLETRLAPTVSRIDQQLGQLGKSAERILEVGKDIATLQDILQPPKLRGELGELLLDQLLEQILPHAHYTLQFSFKNGDRVDAIIRLPDGSVPVDAKFPLESFQRLIEAEGEEERNRKRREFRRAVKGHIDSVVKYIRPDEGTLDFVLMYVPAENLYYETIAFVGEEDVLAYALQRRVHLVSPNTFYAFLQAVARGLRGLKVERYAKEIIGNLEALRGDFTGFRDGFRVLGTHIRHADDKYRDIERDIDKLERKLESPLAEEMEALPASSSEEDEEEE
jgi:DNA recombination protein RmuC